MEAIAYSALRDTFLFRNITDDEFASALTAISLRTESYPKGAVIYSPESFGRGIGFVLNGECEVRHAQDNGADVSINTLLPGDSFGIVSVFSAEDEFPTTIVASRAAKVLYISKDDVYKLVELYPAISKSIIVFFACKIGFLNKKIATFSSSSVEQKMARHIQAVSKAKRSLVIPLNKAKMSTELGIGRASLYRALTQLENDNILKYDNKTLQIIDPKGLERITK